jgi:hypothetical protein
VIQISRDRDYFYVMNSTEKLSHGYQLMEAERTFDILCFLPRNEENNKHVCLLFKYQSNISPFTHRVSNRQKISNDV